MYLPSRRNGDGLIVLHVDSYGINVIKKQVSALLVCFPLVTSGNTEQGRVLTLESFQFVLLELEKFILIHACHGRSSHVLLMSLLFVLLRCWCFEKVVVVFGKERTTGLRCSVCLAGVFLLSKLCWFFFLFVWVLFAGKRLRLAKKGCLSYEC